MRAGPGGSATAAFTRVYSQYRRRSAGPAAPDHETTSPPGRNSIDMGSSIEGGERQ
jgi:hypothetical protein